MQETVLLIFQTKRLRAQGNKVTSLVLHICPECCDRLGFQLEARDAETEYVRFQMLVLKEEE